MAFLLRMLSPLLILKVTAQEVQGQAHTDELATDGLLKQDAQWDLSSCSRTAAEVQS